MGAAHKQEKGQRPGAPAGKGSKKKEEPGCKSKGKKC